MKPLPYEEIIANAEHEIAALNKSMHEGFGGFQAKSILERVVYGKNKTVFRAKKVP